MKKIIITLIIFTFTLNNQIIAKIDFTGARVKNESGDTIKAEISMGTADGLIEIKSGDYADLKSEKGNRYIYWTNEKKYPNSTFSTIKAYSSPDTIIIHKPEKVTLKDNAGKYYTQEIYKYTINHGFLGSLKDENIVATKITREPKKILEEEKASAGKKTKEAVISIASFLGLEKEAKKLIETIESIYKELTDELNGKTNKEKLDILKKFKIGIVEQIIKANIEIDKLEKEAKKDSSKSSDIEKIKKQLNSLKIKERDKTKEIEELEKQVKSYKYKKEELQKIIKDAEEKIENIKKIQSQKGKEHHHSFWLPIHEKLKADAQEELKALEGKSTIDKLKNEIAEIDKQLKEINDKKKSEGKTSLAAESKIFQLDAQKIAKQEKIKSLKK